MQAALEIRSQVSLALRDSEQRRRAHTGGVTQHEPGALFLPVALLCARVEHEREAAVPVDHHGPGGPEIDDDPPALDQFGRADGGVHLQRRPLPRQGRPDLHVALAQVVHRHDHRERVGAVLGQAIPERPAGERRRHLEQDRAGSARAVEEVRPDAFGVAEAKCRVVDGEQVRSRQVRWVEAAQIPLVLRARLPPETHHAPRERLLLAQTAGVQRPRGPREVQAVVGGRGERLGRDRGTGGLQTGGQGRVAGEELVHEAGEQGRAAQLGGGAALEPAAPDLGEVDSGGAAPGVHEHPVDRHVADDGDRRLVSGHQLPPVFASLTPA